MNIVEEFKQLWFSYQQDSSVEPEMVSVMEHLSMEQFLLLDTWIMEQHGRVQGAV